MNSNSPLLLFSLRFRFLDSYKSHGIDLWGITIENEPGAGTNAHYGFNCLNLSAPQERDFVKMNLGPTLEKAGYTHDKFKIMILDDGAHNLKSWADTILSDEEAAKYVSGIAYHWYGNHRMSGFPEKELEAVHQKYPNVFTLNSEACHLEGAGNGRWDFGEHYAYDIIRVSFKLEIN
jgi:glucosylceramidase